MFHTHDHHGDHGFHLSAGSLLRERWKRRFFGSSARLDSPGRRNYNEVGRLMP
jgi:hypothetical protein